MQLNRLFETIYILLNRKNVTAKELSEKFEVSIRTIYRDVETLSATGLPIYMSRGNGGGISLLPEFVLNKTILSDSEKNDILSALQSLNAVNASSTNNTLSKLSTVFGIDSLNWIEVDYSDWSDTKKTVFETIKQATVNRTLLHFNYYNKNGDSSRRTVEPITLWFKDKTWYLKAFCLNKDDFRVFKLNRIQNIEGTNEHFEKKDFPNISASKEVTIQSTKIVIKVDSSQSYRVYDEFDEKDIVKNDDDTYTVTMNFVEDEWVYGYLLSFGNYAKVLEPPHIKDILVDRMKKSLENYS
ncbi:YafY family transcriptional regulator [Alkalicella caledoniensis]|uniref:YafY family transcriptional regulator n=1 Tax=Alkalicella caledoniensis TaxID=2731377 RepID=A0A7G9WAY0_ALKCA|nr:YafY family protein [Alkalicella caledoniensis]QNO15842.1 YafY family transcriptional regulator [Alkalicella caledoniensis]